MFLKALYTIGLALIVIGVLTTATASYVQNLPYFQGGALLMFVGGILVLPFGFRKAMSELNLGKFYQ